MPEGFTPSFFLQLAIALLSAGAVYGAIRSDIKNLHRRLDDERETAKQHRDEDDESFRDIRDKLQGHHGRISHIEGHGDLVDKLALALKGER